MTEQPQDPRRTARPADATPPRRNRDLRVLVGASIAVVLLVGASVLGGYLWGHHDRTNAQPDPKGSEHSLIATKRTLVQVRQDLERTINVLAARIQRLQEQNRVLEIRVSQRTVVPPGF